VQKICPQFRHARFSLQTATETASLISAHRMPSLPTKLEILTAPRIRASGQAAPAAADLKQQGNPALKRLPVELPTTRRPVGIITLKNRKLSPVAQFFIDCAREIAQPLAKRL